MKLPFFGDDFLGVEDFFAFSSAFRFFDGVGSLMTVGLDFFGLLVDFFFVTYNGPGLNSMSFLPSEI